MQDRPTSLLTLRWFLTIAAAYLVGICSVGVALRHNVGFPLDDSWIHQEIARNLVELHSFGFTPGVTSSGSSSTLWTLILSLHYLLFAGHSPVFFPLVLNSLLLTCSGCMLWTLAARDGLPLHECLAFAVLPALSGNLVWLVFTGMEHILFVTLSLLALLLWFRSADESGTSGWGRCVAVGIALGALGVTRPDGLGLGLLLLVLYRWCGRSFADAVRTGIVAFLCLVPSFLLNLRTSGSLLPLTIRGRRFLYLGSDKLHVGRSSVDALILDTYRKVIEHNFFHSFGAWVIVPVLLAVYGTFVVLRRFPSRMALLVLWAILHYASYCFSLPSTGHGGRYQPFVLVLFPSLLAISLFDLGGRLAKVAGASAYGRPLQVGALLLVGVVTAMTLPRWKVGLRDSILDINGCHRQMALWLDEHYASGTKVAVFDIGAIAYFSHVEVVDLGGLVDRNFLPYLLSGRVPQYLADRGVEYVVLPSDGQVTHFAEQLRLTGNPDLRLDPLHTDGIDYNTWLSGNLYTQHAYQYETLFRIVPTPAGRRDEHLQP